MSKQELGYFFIFAVSMDPSLLLVQRCRLLTHAIYMLCRQTALLQDKPLAHRLKHCCWQLLTYTIQGHLELRSQDDCAKQMGIYIHLISWYIYGAHSLGYISYAQYYQRLHLCKEIAGSHLMASDVT